jgi:hypothetical protein
MRARYVEHRIVIKAVFAAVASAVLLTGCVYRRETIPAAAPTTVVVPSPSTTVQRVYTYPEGRYQLYGNGTSDSPYYWVWIPTGAVAPTPPPLPR